MITPPHTYIIAEAGVNHNGDLNLALEMVECAAKSGADAIKFQTFSADRLVTKNARQAEYQTKNIGKEDSQYNMLKKLELSEDNHTILLEHCKKHKIDFLSSAFDIESAKFLGQTLNLPTIKLGSGELTNAPLLLECAKMNVQIILSTGMATTEEIEKSLGVLAFGYLNGNDPTPSIKKFENSFNNNEGQQRLRDKVSLLQCTTAYPCDFTQVNLKAMEHLRRSFGLKTGYSDHTTGSHISIAAVAMGAKIIEKHFTLDRTMEGPDHKASLEPNELTQMVSCIRDVEKSLGSGIKAPDDAELGNRAVARKGLHTSKTIQKGEAFCPENITTKRPEDGLSPYLYWDLIGKTASRDYNEDDAINE